MAPRDLYEVLCVQRDARLSDIRNAYRDKAAWMHPERGGNPTAFEELQEAYAVLSNPQRRHNYDKSCAGGGAAAARQQLRVAGQDTERGDAAAAALVGASATKVPEELEQPVAHIVVSERNGSRTLQLVNAPPMIEGSKLRPGEVLVVMRALPMSNADLHTEGLFPLGEFFGLHGVGQVLLSGPKVSSLQPGDWVLPLLEVDEEGDLKEGASPPGTGRALAVFSERFCLRLALPPKYPLCATHLAVAKSIATAYRMVEEHGQNLVEGDTVVVNAANGVVGQVLVQMLTSMGFQVFAVLRHHPAAIDDTDLACRRLRDLGALKVLPDDDDIKSGILSTGANLPQIAFDGVGGEATARLAVTLSKTGDIVCYGMASGSKKQVLPSGWGKKWRGSVLHFSFDEWVQKNMQENARRVSDILAEVSKLMQAGKLQLDVQEFSTQDFGSALKEMARPSRTAAVVILFPRHASEGGAGLAVEVAQSQVASGPRKLGPTRARGAQLPPVPQDLVTMDKPEKMSWDLDFLEWEEEDDLDIEKRTAAEGDLFKPDPVMDELRIMPYTDDALASPVALEIGAAQGEATQVLFWLPGAGEVPEEHGPWLNSLSASHPGLRVLILRPRIGFDWFAMTDAEAVKLGLRFIVLDDIDNNMDGDVMKSKGELAFPSLRMPEIEALQQIEGASMGLARRAVIEEKEMRETMDALGAPGSRLPFFFGGFGQGGTIALYAAACLMTSPVSGVVYSHSGVPAAGMLGKRLSPYARRCTRLCGVYDRADREVPPDFPEALQHMLSLLGCRSSLDWLDGGDGHDFFDDAAARVSECFERCLEEAARGDAPLAPPQELAARFGGFYGKEELGAKSAHAFDPALLNKWRQSVLRRGGKVSEMVLRGVEVAGGKDSEMALTGVEVA